MKAFANKKLNKLTVEPPKGLLATQFHNDHTFPTEFNKWAKNKRVYEVIATNDKITILFSF